MELVERWPELCPGGHRYERGRVVIGAEPCRCVARVPHLHRTYWCQICGAVLKVPTCTRVVHTSEAMGVARPNWTWPR